VTLTESLQLNSIGKHLISNELGPVFDCLSMAVAAANDKKSFLIISNIVSKWLKPQNGDSQDSEFYSKASQRLASELCALATRYHNCHECVVYNSDDLLFVILSSLLDSRRLESFPSCNLDMMQEKAGELGIDRALTLLDLLNDDSLPQSTNTSHSARLRLLQCRRKEKADEIWKLCENFGATLCQESEVESFSKRKALGSILLCLDSDLFQGSSTFNNFISLESESFKVLRLLRNVISAGQRFQDSDTAFMEKVVFWSIGFLSDQILRIVCSLKYLDQSNSGPSQDSEQQFKCVSLSNLLMCFIELFIASAVWTLREVGASNETSKLSELRRLIRDKLLSPALRRQQCDLMCVLQEISFSAKCIVGSNPTRDLSAPGMHGYAKYLGNDLYPCVLRRSKQMLIAASLHDDMANLQSVMIEAVLGSKDIEEDLTAFMVGTGFPLCSRSTRRMTMPYESPLQKDIDDYLDSVEASMASNVDDSTRNLMVTSKRSFLSMYLLPWICHKRSNVNEKRKLLKLLGDFLHCNAIAVVIPGVNSENDLESLLDMDIAPMLVKGLTLSLLQCLGQTVVDEEYISAIFNCARHAMNTSLIVDRKCLNLFLWCRRQINDTFGKTILDLSKSQVDGAYVWIFFRWVHSIAATLADAETGATDDIGCLRKRCQEAMKYRGGVFDDEPLNLDDESLALEQWEKLLMNFESFVFPSRLENAGHVVNMYAKDRNAAGTLTEQPMDNWTPSRATRRSAKEFMAVVVAKS
jgi:hypothetical protein